MVNKFFKRVTLIVLVLAMAIFGGISITSFAAVKYTNIFSETMDEGEISESRWTLSKGAESSVAVGKVGRSVYRVTPASKTAILQYDDEITLADNEFFQYSVSFVGIQSGARIAMRFGDEKLTPESESLPTATTSEAMALEVRNAGALSIDVRVNSENPNAAFRNAWSGAMQEAGKWHNQAIVNGSGLLGITKSASEYAVAYRIFADGTATLCIGNAYEDNWFTVGVLGYSHNGVSWVHETEKLLMPIASGYPQIVVKQVTDPFFIGKISAAKYTFDAESWIPENGGAPPAGTLVSGSEYEEDFTGGGTSKFAFLKGEKVLSPALSGIVIDNAADDDFIVKRTALSAPDDDRTDKIYEINMSLNIDKLGGNAGAVVYAGADDAALTGATALKFALGDGGKITLAADDGASAETSVKLQESFDLKIACGGNNVNKVYINDAAEPVLTFTKEIKGKFIGLGTTGIEAGASEAKFAVLGAGIAKFSYENGNGGDFTETFDDNKYNPVNMTIATQITHIDADELFQIKDGGLVLSKDNGLTSVVSTTQTYGDFEFEAEISAFDKTASQDGIVDIGISWGRPTGSAYYAGIGTAILAIHGNVFTSLSDVAGLASFSQGTLPDFPTGEFEEDGTTPKTEKNYGKYDFSNGNLVIKLVKTGTTAKLYMYMAGSDADDANRTTPVCTVENDCNGAGTVGLCAVPTGRNMGLTIDKFSIKNLDEHKKDALTVGGDSDRTELTFGGGDDDEIDDPTIKDPTDPDNDNDGDGNKGEETDGKKGCGGCNGMASATAAVPALMAGVGAVAMIERKRK